MSIVSSVLVLADSCTYQSRSGSCVSSGEASIVVYACVALAVVIGVGGVFAKHGWWPMSRVLERRDRRLAELNARIAARPSDWQPERKSWHRDAPEAATPEGRLRQVVQRAFHLILRDL